MTILYLDCFSGAAGDMLLGALLDAGLPLEDLRRALGSLAIDGDAVWTERVTRAGVSATKFHVRGEAPPADRAHDHGHVQGGHHPRQAHAHVHAHGAEERHHHVHRTVADIHALIEGSALSQAGKARARTLIDRLAEAEAAIHDTTPDKVHLHEVGALDSIVDIVGAVYALEALGADRIVASPLNVGSGTIRSAHGLYPVPAPATARLLQGAPIYAGPQAAEMVTPTGALLVTSYAESYGPVPAMRLRTIGYGAGTRDIPETPNVLRVLIGDAETMPGRDVNPVANPVDVNPGAGGLHASGSAPHHPVVVLEADIDDMNPQIFGVLMDRLLAEGALDVFYTAIQMKKNRPGTLLSIVAPPDARERLMSIVFRETTTIGVRYREMARECLDRETVAVETPYGAVRMKVARRNGEILNASPEFEDCARLAGASGRPLKDVQAAATKAFLDTNG